MVVHQDGEDRAYYVDKFGYEEVPEFLALMQAPEKTIQAEGKVTFFVAQCMDFPAMGEYHGELSLVEALKLYREMPDGEMGGKGIGFILQDGSDHAGAFTLVSGGRVQEDAINGVEHYRLNPNIQADIAEAKTYVSTEPVRAGQEIPAEEAAIADRPAKTAMEGEKKQISAKKDSVLATEEPLKNGEKTSNTSVTSMSDIRIADNDAVKSEERVSNEQIMSETRKRKVKPKKQRESVLKRLKEKQRLLAQQRTGPEKIEQNRM